MNERTRPNIIVTGTPGVGKTTHATSIAQETGLQHIDVSKFAIENGCTTEYDDQLQTWVVDEEAVAQKLKPVLAQGGNIIDWHCCDFLHNGEDDDEDGENRAGGGQNEDEDEDETDLIDLVVVLRSSTEALYDRLKARGYSDAKVDENMDSEIMMVVLEDARECYPAEKVVVLESDQPGQLNENVGRVKAWLGQWLENNGGMNA